MYKEKHPLTVCLIGVIDKNKVLLVKRKREPYAGYWGLLGGRQTFGRRIKDIVKMEVREETGFSIRDNIMINGVYSEVLLDNKNEPKDHFLFVVVKAQLDRQKKRNESLEDTDVEEFRWFNLPMSEEDSKLVIPTDLMILRNFDSDDLTFKEFVMKENDGRLEIVEVSE